MVTFHFSEGSVSLNPEQSRIVHAPQSQNLRILASAGSGKTTTLTTRIAWLLTNCGAKPSEIVLMTFTHNSANVMRQRLEALVGAKRILCGTFHALSQQILNEQSPGSLKDMYHVDELPLKLLDFLDSPDGKQWCKTIRWIFIDEFQDINDTQYKLIRALHHSTARVTIVGDDAQNIYTWRGSCVDYILNFHKRFPDVMDIQLSTNYRSSSAIVAVANSVMRYIPTLPHKELMTAVSTHNVRPEVHYFARTSDERDWVVDAAFRATGSTVILSKYNSVLYAYEAAFLKLGVRVRFVQTEDMEKGTIYLSTFHGSKGLEWDNVFLVRMNDEVFPQKKDEDSVLQERRLFYVAVTRARNTLTFSYSQNVKSLSRFVREIHRPLLVWRNLPQYELSTLDSENITMNVSDWVNYLTGEDYRNIKWLRMLPTFFNDQESVSIAENQKKPEWITPYWWAEQGMATEFFDFLCAFWHHEIGISRPESGGQWDREAQRLIWTIKIGSEDAELFVEHRTMFEFLVDRFFGTTEPGTAPPQVYYTDVISAIQSKGYEFDQPTMIRIIQIIHKMRTMLYNLRFANVSLSDLQFEPIRHTPPQESRCPLIEAWRKYTEPRVKSLDMLQSIYLIGICRSIATGRAGVLENLPGEKEWSRSRLFLSLLATRIQTILSSNKTVPIMCRVQTEVVPGIMGQIDMIVGNTAWFFIPGDQPGELRRLDRMLIAMLSIKNSPQPIHRIRMYQIISDTSMEWGVEEWSTHAQNLLVAYIEARVAHTVP